MICRMTGRRRLKRCYMKYLFYVIGSVLGALVATLVSHGDVYAFKYYLLIYMIAGVYVELTNER